MRELFAVLGVLVLGGGLVVAILRFARAQGMIKTRQAGCEVCGQRGPVLAVTYWQNTGMMVMRRTWSRAGLLCRSCSTQAFWKMTSHTAALGWWGTISFCITPLILINNMAHGLATWGLPTQGEMVQDALEGQREYALSLLATKDEDTVAEVLARATGASEGDVRAYLAKLKPPA
jgi:hypothetical protein